MLRLTSLRSPLPTLHGSIQIAARRVGNAASVVPVDGAENQRLSTSSPSLSLRPHGGIKFLPDVILQMKRHQVVRMPIATLHRKCNSISDSLGQLRDRRTYIFQNQRTIAKSKESVDRFAWSHTMTLLASCPTQLLAKPIANKLDSLTGTSSNSNFDPEVHFTSREWTEVQHAQCIFLRDIAGKVQNLHDGLDETTSTPSMVMFLSTFRKLALIPPVPSSENSHEPPASPTTSMIQKLVEACLLQLDARFQNISQHSDLSAREIASYEAQMAEFHKCARWFGDQWRRCYGIGTTEGPSSSSSLPAMMEPPLLLPTLTATFDVIETVLANSKGVRSIDDVKSRSKAEELTSL